MLSHVCSREGSLYERGFALEEVPFEEEFEQTNNRLWRKHEKQQQKSEETGQFVGECTDVSMYLHAQMISWVTCC